MYSKDYSDEFLDWVNTHFKKAMAVTQKISIDPDNISYVLMSTSGRKIKTIMNLYTNTVIVINSEKPNKIGYAKCHKNDKCEYDIGVALAFARYCKETIPDYVMSELNK